jgi:hypothetical protein
MIFPTELTVCHDWLTVEEDAGKQIISLRKPAMRPAEASVLASSYMHPIPSAVIFWPGMSYVHTAAGKAERASQLHGCGNTLVYHCL